MHSRRKTCKIPIHEHSYCPLNNWNWNPPPVGDDDDGDDDGDVDGDGVGDDDDDDEGDDDVCSPAFSKHFTVVPKYTRTCDAQTPFIFLQQLLIIVTHTGHIIIYICPGTCKE